MNTNSLRFRVTLGVIAAVLVIAVWLINRPESHAAKQSTDDAYVRADFTIVAPQVAGRISRVEVNDHQTVDVGAPLIGIDDRDLRIALDSAKAGVTAARAQINSLQAQLARQQSAIAAARATLAGDEAALKLAEANHERYANLARDGSGSVQAKQQAETQRDTQRAARERDQAGLRSAEQQSTVMLADLEKATAALQAAEAQQAAAELNLSYTQITAPVAGVVAQRTARVGGFVRVGEPLLSLVPLDALYIEANFRETQLARVQPGQPVHIDIDALPGVNLKGQVESVGPASGVSFSAVQPHNATGNFTKIVQRLPVRIRLAADQEALKHLRVGMSVRPTIDVSAPVVAAR